MKKRFLSIFLTLCMVLTLLPVTALAVGDWNGKYDTLGDGSIGFNYAASSHLKVTMPTSTGNYTYGTTSSDGSAVTETAANAASLPESGWNWAVQKHATDANGIEFTLTLNNATITCTGSFDTLIFRVGLNINLVGSSSLTTSGSMYSAIYGISDSKLYISDAGSGSLACQGANGFFVHGNLTILSGTVSATGSYSGILSAGASKISGGTVTIRGNTTYGISAANNSSFIISGGTVTTTGIWSAFSSGIIISNCTATASTDINGAGAGAYVSASNGTYKYVHTVSKSSMPAVTVTTATKAAATQKSIDFALTSAQSGTYSVYADNSTATLHSTVTAASSSGKLTLTDSGDNIEAGIYYVSFSDGTNPESDRLMLMVTNQVVVSKNAIAGVTVPAAGATPVTTITECAQYTGTVAWSGSPATFGYSTAYTATITLTPKTGYTLTGVAANFFTVSGASSVSNSANNGVVTAAFPATAAVPPSGGGGSVTPPALVTRIDNGGSTTGSNLGQLVSGGKTLTVDGDKGAKLVFDTESLKGIGGQTSGDIKVEMKDVSPTHQESLPGKQVFSLTVSSGSSTITNFGGAVTVTLPYTLKEGESANEVTVWYLASDGTMSEIPCTYDPATKLATFTVTHFSLYVVGVPWNNPFTDVRDNDWFYGAVEFVSQNGMMKGIGGTDFSPNTTVTRGMLVTILWRLENEPATAKTIAFTDVSDGNWYAKAVAWSAANNIVTGYAGKFNPDDALTREQLAAILYRYAAYKNYNVSAGDSLSAYVEKPSDWALSSVSWAVAKGLIKGSGSSLAPKGSATRAQTATILQRFIETTAK